MSGITHSFFLSVIPACHHTAAAELRACGIVLMPTLARFAGSVLETPEVVDSLRPIFPVEWLLVEERG